MEKEDWLIVLYFSAGKYDIFKFRIRCIITKSRESYMQSYVPTFYLLKFFLPKINLFRKIYLFRKAIFLFLRCSDKETYQADVGDERANL